MVETVEVNLHDLQGFLFCFFGKDSDHKNDVHLDM